MKNTYILLFIFLSNILFYSENFSFIVIGDTRPPVGTDNYDNFIKQTERMKLFNPSFIINLGDMIYGYDPKNKDLIWEKYKEILSTINFTYYQIPGNHDVYSVKAEEDYKKEFNKLYYSFDFKNYHFVLLDNSEKSIWGYISPEQYDWLKNDLEKNKVKNIFVFMHVSPWYIKLVDKKYSNFWKNSLHPLFVKYKVKSVFGGHIHQYGPTIELDGIKYFITAGGGAEIEKTYKNYGGDFHFMSVDVSNDKIDYKVVFDNKVLTDSQADVSINHIFEENNTNKLFINYDSLINTGEQNVKLQIKNPYYQTLIGSLVWIYNNKNFKIIPDKLDISINSKKQETYNFKIKLIDRNLNIYDFPSINIKTSSGDITNTFIKDLAVKKSIKIKKTSKKFKFNGDEKEWLLYASGKINDPNEKEKIATIYTCYDDKFLYISLKAKDEDFLLDYEDNMIFLNNNFMIGIDRFLKMDPLNNDDICFELSNTKKGLIIYDRVNGEALDYKNLNIKFNITNFKDGIFYELAIPKTLLDPLILQKGAKIGINFGIVNSNKVKGREIFEWQPGIGGGFGIDDLFRSELHFGLGIFE